MQTRIAASSIVLFAHVDQIECSGQLVGREFPISVGKFDGQLLLPKAGLSMNATSPEWGQLRTPLMGDEWQWTNESYDWGRAFSEPAGNFSLKTAALQFSFDNAPDSEDIESLQKGVFRWMARFQDAYEVITRNLRHKRNRVFYHDDQLDTYLVNENGDAKRIRPIAPIVLITIGTDRSPHADQFQKILDIASEKMSLSLAARIQLSAYRALYNDDTRKAVVETATCAELLLTQAIAESLSRYPDISAETLLSGYRTLSNRIQLARAIGLDLNEKELLSQIVEPRNRVIHRGDDLSPKAALTAVSAVDDLLDKFGAMP